MSKINHYNYIPACTETTTLTCGSYTLLNRQEPIHARISTNNERDRRPIDPPPIIQIKIPNASPQQTDTFHQSSYFFMCANLAHPTNDNEIYTPTHNALSGQTVSSMYKLKDIDNHDGAFFIFGDLSVKVEGSFRLKLSLFEITCTGAVYLDSIFTQTFVVYPAKKFPGMLDSTFLSRSFSDQSARIRIRKENRAQMANNNSPSSLTTSMNGASRKRKLEIQTGKYILCKKPTPMTSVPVTAYPGVKEGTVGMRLVSPNHSQSGTYSNHTSLRSLASAFGAHSTSSPAPSEQPIVVSIINATSVVQSERRASINSNGNDSCCCNSSYTSSNSSQSSPVATSFSTSRISLPPLSPPPQSYDSAGTSITTSYLPFNATFLPSSPLPSVKLPSIRDFLSSFDTTNVAYRQQKTSYSSRAENDAAAAMMQLSSVPKNVHL